VVGNLTRLAQVLHFVGKTYEGTIRFGFATETYDAEGEVRGPVQQVEGLAGAIAGYGRALPWSDRADAAALFGEEDPWSAGLQAGAEEERSDARAGHG